MLTLLELYCHVHVYGVLKINHYGVHMKFLLHSR